MQSRERSRVGCVVALSVMTLVAITSAPHAQTRETITGRAEVKTAGGASASAPFTLHIDRYATDAEQQALISTVKKDGTEAARKLLMMRADAGTVQLGAQTETVKYAFARAIGGGRLITAITSEPMLFLGAGLPDAKPTANYPLGVVLIEVPDKGFGHGELVPAARVRADEHNAIVTDAYNASDVVRLENVARK